MAQYSNDTTVELLAQPALPPSTIDRSLPVPSLQKQHTLALRVTQGSSTSALGFSVDAPNAPFAPLGNLLFAGSTTLNVVNVGLFLKAQNDIVLPCGMTISAVAVLDRSGGQGRHLVACPPTFTATCPP
jgi:hypothetical protein